MKRTVLALSISALLGGCTSHADRADPTGSTSPRLESMLGSDRGRGPARRTAALSLPADAGSFTGVYEKRAVNVQRQDIMLSGSVKGLPANKLEVVAVRSSGADDDPNIGAIKPSEEGIAAEMRTRFPGVAMQVVVRPMQNDYGPFGLAVGQSAHGARCVYAWQWIDNVESSDRGLTSASLFRSRPTVSASVRIGLCGAGKTADELAGYVERLRIEPAMLRPDGQPAREPVVAAAFTSEPKASSPAPAKPKQRRRAHRKPPATTVARPQAAAEPIEPTTAADRAPARAASTLGAGQAAFAQAPGDPTPAPSARAPGGGVAAAPAPTSSGVPTQLDRSLPPEAYRGPSARGKAPAAQATVTQ